MNEKPLVSIALCTYNGERFLSQQLDSIVNQSYSQIEIIAVDDCSTDNTVSILQKYAEEYSFIQVFENSENIGYINNFEKALKLCSADLIALSDQDDIWASDKIEKQVKAIGDNLLIYHDSEFVNEEGVSMKKKMSDIVNLYRGDRPETFLFFNCLSGHSILLKKQLRDEMLPFPQAYFHDWWIGYVATNLGTIDFIDQCLVKYRQHAYSGTDILKRKRKEKIKKQINEDKIYQDKILWLQSCASYPKNKNPELVQALYEAIQKGINSYITLSLAKLLFANRKILFAINKKNRLSKMNLTIRELWGSKMRRLFGY